MKRTTPALMLALAALAFGCSKSRTDTKSASSANSAGADSAAVTELAKQVKKMDKRLKKIERLLAQALDRPPEPDPAATYAMPIAAADPWVGTEHAKVTIIEGFEFA